jgi:hypothetical protein
MSEACLLAVLDRRAAELPVRLPRLRGHFASPGSERPAVQTRSGTFSVLRRFLT